MIFNFIWNGEMDKIKRNILYNEKQNGGLNVPNIQSFYSSLKIYWLKKFVDPQNHSAWKILLLDMVEKFG